MYTHTHTPLYTYLRIVSEYIFDTKYVKKESIRTVNLIYYIFFSLITSY